MKKKIMTIIISALLAAGCANTAADAEKKTDAINEAEAINETAVTEATDTEDAGDTGQQKDNEAENPEAESVEADPKADIDLSLRPDESGKIMVLMYHNIGNEEKEWTRTPANFLKDLSVLYEKGYRPVSLSDYVTGNITTEQGYTPIVLTFDDGNLNNFEYLESGIINPDSAVGILMGFHERYKGFPLEATFFLNGNGPFGQQGMEGKKIKFLLDSGMDIGNHTKSHANFKNATGDEIQEQIGAQAQYLKGMAEKEEYEINTLALPFGARPKGETETGYLAQGSFNGIPYENIAILNVGWNPGYSPYDARFDSKSIPRIRASEIKVDSVGLYNYLDYFDRNPQERFISDGKAEIVTIPEEKEGLLCTAGNKEIYIYSPE